MRWVLLGLSALLSVQGAVPRASAQGDSKHLVSIHVDGQTRTVPTEVKTVGETLQKAGIVVSKDDLVEPRLDTPILEDAFNINVYRARPVLITDENKTYVKVTAYTSARKIAQEAKLSVAPEDEVVLEQSSDFVTSGSVGQRLVVRKSKLIHLNLYGSNVDLRSRKETVGELLAEKNIRPAQGDQVGVPLNTPLVEGMTLFIARMGSQVQTVEEAIPFPEQTIQDANQYVGTKKVDKPGVNGKKAVTYQITTTNGAESKRQVIQEVIITPPTPQITIVGTKQVQLRANVAEDKQRLMIAVGIAENEWAAADYIIAHESAWCPTKWQGTHTCPVDFVPLHAVTDMVGYGLCQSTPAGKMASAGADWATNPITQLKWCTNYAVRRYGSWTAAYNHWLSRHSW